MRKNFLLAAFALMTLAVQANKVNDAAFTAQQQEKCVKCEKKDGKCDKKCADCKKQDGQCAKKHEGCKKQDGQCAKKHEGCKKQEGQCPKKHEDCLNDGKCMKAVKGMKVNDQKK